MKLAQLMVKTSGKTQRRLFCMLFTSPLCFLLVFSFVPCLLLLELICCDFPRDQVREWEMGHTGPSVVSRHGHGRTFPNSRRWFNLLRVYCAVERGITVAFTFALSLKALFPPVVEPITQELPVLKNSVTFWSRKKWLRLKLYFFLVIFLPKWLVNFCPGWKYDVLVANPSKNVRFYFTSYRNVYRSFS